MSNPDPGHVLLVAPRAAQREALAAALGAVGWTVHPAVDGRRGLERFAAGAAVDAVVLSLALPDMDGWRLARLLRGARAEPVPLALLTRSPRPADLAPLLAPLAPARLLPADIDPEELARGLGEGRAPEPGDVVLVGEHPTDFAPLRHALAQRGRRVRAAAPDEPVAAAELVIVHAAAAAADGRLERLAAAGAVVVVALAAADAAVAGRLAARGADACVALPLDADRLLALEERVRLERTGRRAEAQASAEACYRALCLGAPVGLCRISLGSGRLVECNDTFAQLFGYADRAACLARFVAEAHEPGSADAGWLAEAARAAEPTELERPLLRADGAPFWGRLSLRRSGPDSVEGCVVDITAEKEAETRLIESRRQLRTLLANLPGMAYRCLLDRHWTLEFASEGAYDLTGHPPSALIGNEHIAFNDLIHPDDRERVRSEVEAAVAEQRPFRLTYRLITATGQTKWVWEQGVAVPSEPLALEGFITDITERQREAELLRRREARFRWLVEQSPVAMALVHQRRITYINHAGAALLGTPDPAALLGRAIWDFVPQDDWPAVQRLVASIEDRHEPLPRASYALQRLDGSVLEAELTALPMHAHGPGALVVARDCTGDRELEQTERLRMLGRLAHAVAHQVNNRLTVVLQTAEEVRLALAARGADPGVLEQLDAIARTVDQGAADVRRLQELAGRRQDPPEQTLLDLADIARAALPELRRFAARSGHGVTVELQPAGPVRGSARELQEVVEHLAANALEAMPAGGSLILRSGTVDHEAWLAVHDGGRGISVADQQRVFDPFFTTKPGRGYGLGLSLAYGTIRRHRGDIVIESRKGEGAAVTLRLPLAQGPSAQGSAAMRAERGLSILVVEDDVAVQRLLMRMLDRLGHRCVAAETGAEALTRFAAGGFDLVITDYGLPDTCGTDLARELKTQQPELPVLLATGWGAELEVDDSVDDVISKPYGIDKLAAAIGAVAGG